MKSHVHRFWVDMKFWGTLVNPVHWLAEFMAFACFLDNSSSVWHPPCQSHAASLKPELLKLYCVHRSLEGLVKMQSLIQKVWVGLGGCN